MPNFSDRISKGLMTEEEAASVKALIKGIYENEDYYPLSLLVCRKERLGQEVLYLRMRKLVTEKRRLAI